MATVSRKRSPPASPRATSDEILDVNRRYHDVAADDYDAKWGIDFGAVGQAQVLGKLTKLLGPSPGPYARSLEIGAGTGYFSLNLVTAGVVGHATCTDISPGMLETLEANARKLGRDVETAACDAAELPFADGAFDLVLGHAVLHHLPALECAFAEFHRVLAPGGQLLVGFHVGDTHSHKDSGYGGHPVSLDVYRWRPEQLASLASDSGFTLHSQLVTDLTARVPQACLFFHKAADNPVAAE